MSNTINGGRYNVPINRTASKTKSSKSDDNFKGRLLEGALSTVSTAASMAPGGSVISSIAKGVQTVLGSGGSSENDQMTKMHEMQKENQEFNLEYFELQQSMQSDNRRFTTVSNLMKARHDTAKTAINNMHV